ncbi:SRPBCC domain-containing protein [bacterium]|nr:MAG: SRPBCC domain-containing protein [bacterium]
MTSTDTEFVISRTFDAPRAVVWQAFAEPERLVQWWGPKGFRMETMASRFEPGGIYHYRMRSEQGNEMWGRFAYREIVPPERTVFVMSFSDEGGRIVRAPFGIAFPLEVLTTVAFNEVDGKTELTITGRPLNATEEEREVYRSMHDSMRTGFGNALDELSRQIS